MRVKIWVCCSRPTERWAQYCPVATQNRAHREVSVGLAAYAAIASRSAEKLSDRRAVEERGLSLGLVLEKEPNSQP